MSELRKANYDAIFFVTLTVVSWIDVFTRKDYCEEIVKNLQYCQQHKGLELYSYVIMTNHIHLLAAQKDGELNRVLRDFKSYSAKQLLGMILNNEKESRKDWMKIVFQYNAKYKRQNAEYMFWQRNNHAIDCFSSGVFEQKRRYIRQNPVRAGFVEEPEHWWYCSANPRSPIKILDV
ncbi:MAG: transposase [Chitinophagaceae bacterium]|nr:transposase [Chitinophagaceae bacterium]